MGIAPYIRRLRELVGHELLVLPSVAVLPRDPDGRVLLVRHADTGDWATIGGAIEPDEPPQAAALREAREEAGVTVSLGPVLAVLGGPELRVRYPNGDETSYVSVVYAATVVSGSPRPDNDETTAVRWWLPEEIPDGETSVLTKRILEGAGLLGR